MMMRREKKVRITGAGLVLAATVAAGAFLYQQDSQVKERQEQTADGGGEEEQDTKNQVLTADREKENDGTAETAGDDQVKAEDADAADASETAGQGVQADETDGTAGQTALTDETNGTADTADGGENAQTAEEETAAAALPALDFSEDTQMLWPVNGQVVIDYSMDGTTYFQTLDQYKYNSALILGADAGEAVQAAANGRVKTVEEETETGLTLTMDLGNGFEAVYGQLKDLTVAEGDTVSAGSILGYVDEPTRYYVKEGNNLYFAVRKDGKAVDPMIYLETVME